jgi:transcription elongation factor Elf1
MQTVNSNGPECPHCKHAETPDEAFYFRPEVQDIECSECGQIYEVEAEFIVTWCSWSKEKSNGET